MIKIQVQIDNPFKQEFDNIYNVHGKFPIPNKYWEFEILKTSELIKFYLSQTCRQDHAGFTLCLSLFYYSLVISIYDNRHWDYEPEEWYC